MIRERLILWDQSEYTYPLACGFTPFMMSYLHDDQSVRPCMLVVPGGGYGFVSPTEGYLVAKSFYEAGYNAFVLVYTTDILMRVPLKIQPLQDISRAVRMIRKNAERFHINPKKLAVCGFSAGAHLCGSLCVHYEDVKEECREYEHISNRPDAAILAYPVITAGKYAHMGSVITLLGRHADAKEIEYMSLEKHVTKDTPPCFLWQTAEDQSVRVINSYLYAEACLKAKVPFAHHVFSKGPHGLSVASEEWLEGEYGEFYTLEQTVAMLEKIRAGELDVPAETADKIEEQCHYVKGVKENFCPEEKEQMRKVLKDVGIWPEMAKRWLEDIL